MRGKNALILICIVSVFALIVLLFYVKRLRFQNNLKERRLIELSVKPPHISPPCTYQLNLFDFHYKKETGNPNIIMLGNSLIRHGKWDSLLSRKDVINRGISGDRLKCICERLSYLDGYNPKICFIEGGINDLPGSNPDSLFEDYKQIVSYFKKRKIIPIINLVLFINPRAGLKWDIRKNYISINKQVAYLDERLIVYSSSEHITYIDLNKKLCHDNVLMDKYTTDGVHLTSEGYRIWSDEIKNILKKYNIRR